MRQKIYNIIEKGNSDNKWSMLYDSGMLITIIVSLVPLAFKKQTDFFFIIDKVTVGVFIIDYILRWITADFRHKKKSNWNFVAYPFTFMAIIDILTIFPSLYLINKSFHSLKALRVLKIIRLMKYSKNFQIIMAVFRKSKEALMIVTGLAISYILGSALIMFNIEPNIFDNFFDAIYWSTITLTTVGYGDIYPISDIGKAITVLSSFLGIAIIALPAGIITAAYMEELEHKYKDKI